MKIDLDTIDETNLNRQFLFNKENVKKHTKCEVAVLVAKKMNPAGIYEAQFASIYDKKYDVNFFKNFDVIVGALDNIGKDWENANFFSESILV